MLFEFQLCDRPFFILKKDKMRFTALIAKVVLPGIFATPIILEMVEGYLLIMLVVFIGFLLGRWYQAGNRKN